MKSSVMKTVLATALVTALAVSGLAYYVGPRIMNPQSPFGMQNAAFTSAPVPATDQVIDPASAQQDQPTSTASAKPTAYRTSNTRTYSSRPVRHRRSTEKSVLIVAGSAGTGAAIGALAGGGKGAAIGAIAGGVGGLVYDRLTANK